MDLIDDPQPGNNTPEFTVAEIAGAVKRLVENELGFVRVRGEVGRVVLARSGHLYFDLKDDRNVLSCMTWKGQISGIGVMPEEGMEVVAEGRMTASGFQSKFSLNATQIAVAGEGALMALLEKRKKALAAEGLFAEERKKPLPFLPEVIGVVTSPQGAVIRDILHRLRDRFPRKVLVWPVAVQGQACAPQVANAIEGFNAMTAGGAMPRPDLLIVARGGGSIEDLWGFNEEVVARAAAASDIPLISAVGHETDTTLIDFVSDQRAPTPTAAAELAVPVRLDLLTWVEGQGARLSAAANRGVTDRKTRLRDLARALPRPEGLTAQARQRFDHVEARLPQALKAAAAKQRLRLVEALGSLRPATLRQAISERRRGLAERVERLRGSLSRRVGRAQDDIARMAPRLRAETLEREMTRQSEALSRVTLRASVAGQTQTARWRQRLDGLERIHQTLGYRATLERGYAVVRGDGAVVTGKSAAEKAAALEIEFADGKFAIGNEPAKKAKAKTKPKSPEQGSLF